MLYRDFDLEAGSRLLAFLSAKIYKFPALKCVGVNNVSCVGVVFNIIRIYLCVIL